MPTLHPGPGPTLILILIGMAIAAVLWLVGFGR